MNRHQRRAAKHRSPIAAQRALFEETFRKALSVHGIELLDVASGSQDIPGAHAPRPVWILTVRRDGATATLSSPSQPLPQMVEGVVAALNNAAHGDDDTTPARSTALLDALTQTRKPALPSTVLVAEPPSNSIEAIVTARAVDNGAMVVALEAEPPKPTPSYVDLLGDGGELGALLPGGGR